MKLLLDENLSPVLARRLQDIFPGTAHVEECRLGMADDAVVWEFARANGYVVATKDSDFYELGLLQGLPPKVIWIRSGNCTTARVEALLRKHSIVAHTFEADSNSVLVLG